MTMAIRIASVLLLISFTNTKGRQLIQRLLAVDELLESTSSGTVEASADGPGNAGLTRCYSRSVIPPNSGGLPCV